MTTHAELIVHRNLNEALAPALVWSGKSYGVLHLVIERPSELVVFVPGRGSGRERLAGLLRNVLGMCAQGEVCAPLHWPATSGVSDVSWCGAAMDGLHVSARPDDMLDMFCDVLPALAAWGILNGAAGPFHVTLLSAARTPENAAAVGNGLAALRPRSIYRVQPPPVVLPLCSIRRYTWLREVSLLLGDGRTPDNLEDPFLRSVARPILDGRPHDAAESDWTTLSLVIDRNPEYGL